MTDSSNVPLNWFDSNEFPDTTNNSDNGSGGITKWFSNGVRALFGNSTTANNSTPEPSVQPQAIPVFEQDPFIDNGSIQPIEASDPNNEVEFEWTLSDEEGSSESNEDGDGNPLATPNGDSDEHYIEYVEFWDDFRDDWSNTPAVYNFSKRIMNRQPAGKNFVLQQAIKALYLTRDEIRWITGGEEDVPRNVLRNITAVANAISKVGDKTGTNQAIKVFTDLQSLSSPPKYARLQMILQGAIKILQAPSTI